MIPSIGRVVHVCLSADCAQKIGGNAREGDLAPAIITRVFSPDCINVRLFGDGPGEVLWSTSLLHGDQPGYWRWPKRIEEAHAES